MSDDLVKRLEAVEAVAVRFDGCGGGEKIAGRLRNPDGPEAAAELTRLRERNAELEREGASKILSTREAVRILRDAWRESARRAEEFATENPQTNEQWRAYGAMEAAYAHADELDPERDAIFESCELAAAQARIASLEATVRELERLLEMKR